MVSCKKKMVGDSFLSKFSKLGNLDEIPAVFTPTNLIVKLLFTLFLFKDLLFLITLFFEYFGWDRFTTTSSMAGTHSLLEGGEIPL